MAGASLTECREVAGGLDLLGLMGASVGPVPGGPSDLPLFLSCAGAVCAGAFSFQAPPLQKRLGGLGGSPQVAHMDW